MKPPARAAAPTLPSAQEIDARYGLEPVYEPSAASVEPTQFICVQCPYCGERYETAVDLSAGSITQIEDCQVCCQPIDLTVQVDENGAVAGVTACRS